ncbi:MAG: hypothetical protein IJA86_04415 [Clostridia bacterium]|nr:hypothetical protein [Clostridia bacterium]
MKITLEIKDMDYGALIAALLPTVHDIIGKEEKSFVNKILLKLTALPPATVQKMVNLLPRETQDEIVVLLVSKNKEKILEFADHLAKEKNISFCISNFQVEI